MVQRMQKELLNDSMFIERLESDDENDPTVAAQQNDFSCETIQLEKVTNIDEIFSTTQTGNEVMEILRTNTSPNEQCLKTIKTVLCDFLRSNYGLRPPTFYKNLLAQLLVKRYPVLASATCDVPQALWFHPNARGKNRHSGRLHYHMEYLARKSGERVIPRNKLQRVSQLDTLPDVSPIIPANDMDQLIIEQKFLCPGPNTKARAIELWQLTFADRDIFRKRAEMGTYLKDNPMSTAFNGLLITLDFEALVHNTNNFMDQFEDLKPMVLARYHELYQNITDDTARVLAIIRKYNPSRGAKRAKDADPVKENALKDIIEWLQEEDPLPEMATETPMLYFRVDCGTIRWRDHLITVEGNLLHCFGLLCQCFVVFNCKCHPADKQFFLYIMTTLFGVGTVTTAGENFRRSNQ
ncbi:uncharacterized protein LOC131680435 isoform X2 [Topomyia yanbarensis]|uniref:uncharacterized protein LOC131680435 isoform X2 n=1 Tax=Topomyia yanbarensis TaxID=2498891 RepID=UPI00273C328D|nr:uncharacterized protein LOC131680435 isoform X2 [Topomyia yanbarensis]